MLCFLIAVAGVTSVWAFADTVVLQDKIKIEKEDFVVKLKIDGAAVTVRRGDYQSACYFRVTYAKDRCQADVRFDEVRSELRIELDIENLSFFKDNADRDYAEILLHLPRKTHIHLYADIKAGESAFDLGDVHLKNFQLDNWAGEVVVNFDQPNHTCLELFDVSVRMGELKLNKLGNARFEQADINGGVGELLVDFTGEPMERTMARIDLDVGETDLILPRNIGIKLRVSKFLFLSNIDYPDWFNKRGKYFYSKNYSETEHSLYLIISSGVGELNIDLE